MKLSLPDEKQERVPMLVKQPDVFRQQMQKVPQEYIDLYFTCLIGLFLGHSHILNTISTALGGGFVGRFAVTEEN